MTKQPYSLEYKINIIKELLKETMDRQETYVKNPDCFGEDFWTWQQSERVTYLTVLDILNDDLSYIANDILERAQLAYK